MTIELPVATRRQPFVFGSGCTPVSVPTVSVVDTCSLPDLTSADVAPRPIVFNVPQVPVPQMSPACIDMTVVASLRYAGTNDPNPPSNRASFRTESGYDDCLEGRYNLHLSLELPCVLRYLSSATYTGSFRKDISRPRIRLRFNRDTGPNRCALKPYGSHSRWHTGLTRPISIQLELPCDKRLAFSSNLNHDGRKIISVGKDNSYKPVSCTYKIAVNLNGISGDMTYVDNMSVRSDGIWIRYSVLHFRKGVLEGVNSHMQRGGEASRSAEMKVAGPYAVAERMDSGMAVRAPYAGWKWTKILGFTRCENKR